MVAPGFCVGWATNLLSFRVRPSTDKILLSLPFSVVVSTILANLVGRYFPFVFVLSIFLASAVTAMSYGIVRWVKNRHVGSMTFHLHAKIAFALAFLWMCVVIGSLVDIQVGHKLYVGTALWDHSVRIAFLNSAIRSGPPPWNPFNFVGHHAVARYYYYWYVLCSYPARLSHISARYVLYGSSVWAGFCLAALIPVYLKDFIGIKQQLRRKSVVGIMLLAVTGLDILPTIYEFIRARFTYADMEWWDTVQVTSWEDALLWVPHHVAALVACFIGFLCLWSIRTNQARAEAAPPTRVAAVIFAALSFAAAAGLSVYVTFTFAIFLIVWGFRFLAKREYKDFAVYGITGALTIAISIPYLHDLLPRAAAGAPSNMHAAVQGGFIQFGLRTLPSFLVTPFFLRERGFVHPDLFAPLGVIVVYILEFGLFFFVGWERLVRDWRMRSRLDDAEIACWYLVSISMFVITFVRSSVIASNDLAFRSAMFVQFILLLWAAGVVDEWIFDRRAWRSNHRRVTRVLVASTLFLGVCGTLYSLAILRTYTVLDDKGMIADSATWLPAPHRVGTALFDIRQAYAKLDKTLPPESITQYNPMMDDYLPLLEYDNFQSVDAFPNCGTEFGGDISLCPPVQGLIADLFNKPGNYDIHAICRRLSIDVLVARASDPTWKDHMSWVWTNPPIVANGYIRAFRCD